MKSEYVVSEWQYFELLNNFFINFEMFAKRLSNIHFRSASLWKGIMTLSYLGRSLSEIRQN